MRTSSGVSTRSSRGTRPDRVEAFLVASLAAKVPAAFAAGLISVVTPCVLPLVPGYLSAISAVEANRLGEKGVALRVVRSSLPFILGFTVVFVLLGAGAAAAARLVDTQTRNQIAGFVLVVLGLVFLGLLHLPERAIAPGLLAKARSRSSNLMLGAAFAVCAAPCIGTMLGSILTLAADSRTITHAVLLLVAYSAGLGVAFILAGVAFARAMGTFRWVRNRYTWLRVIAGVTLVALGLLLFFNRDWWLRVMINRLFEAIGLGEI